ncbi:MAG TPA: S8 family serine peptidase [Vicinamibacterales bacterium]
MTRDAVSRVLATLPPNSHRVARRFQRLPYVAIEATPAALETLAAAGPDVVRVMDDAILRPVLADSVPLIQADQVWAAGYTGAGTTIAIVDTGVDATHPFLAGKVVEEACYSTTSAGVSRSVCPNGQDEMIGTGAAVPCPLDVCLHGTHVAGIASGNGTTGGVPFSGVAKDAQLMAVQVFSELINPQYCGGADSCAGAFTSDLLAGLERVRDVAAGGRNIVSVNMSLGGGSFTSPCDTDAAKPIIDTLRSMGIATVVAAGNSGGTAELSTPACISSAISVGSTDKSDVVSSFSNVASFMSLFAPGESITSSVPGGGYHAYSGTSMATPHVAGTFALLKQAVPSESVIDILSALQQTGKPITDTRTFGTVTAPRIEDFDALTRLIAATNPSPAVASLSPTHARVNTGVSLTVVGSGFNSRTVVRWNGVAVPTTAATTSKLQATIPASLLTTPGTAQVDAFAPTPGGGTSSSVTFTIDPPPSVTGSVSAVAPGGSVTATLANGLGGASDWLALAPAGAPDTSYLQWVYIGSGVANRTWTVTMPTTPGSYEFRLFLNNGFTRGATSAPILVDGSINPVPGVTSLAPSAMVVGGPAFTLTVNGARFTPSSVVRWNGADRRTTFTSASVLQASISAADIAAIGSAQVSVFTPAPGGGSSPGVAFTIAPVPTLAVDSNTVGVGANVTVTLTNGLGGLSDWIAFAATSDPNTKYVQYVYVGSGVATRTWTVTAPSTPGTYEFRLFLNNGYVRASTSPTVTVVPGPNPVPVLTSITPAGAPLGGPGFTLEANGSGFVSSSIVRWNGQDRPTTFVSGAKLQAAITAADLSATSTAQVAVFNPQPAGGLSTSMPFTVGGTPTLTVDTTSAVTGAPVTVTLAGGFGGSQDWIALAPTTAANTGYVQYIYVGAGVSSRTWTVTMPSTPGTYEFRLFLNNGYTRAATSQTVTVQSGTAPTLGVSATSVKTGAAVTVTLVNGYGGGSDWLALAASSAADTNYVQYVYVGNGVTTRTWTVNMPATAGTYEFRLFLNNSYTRAATSPPVTVTP